MNIHKDILDNNGVEGKEKTTVTYKNSRPSSVSLFEKTNINKIECNKDNIKENNLNYQMTSILERSSNLYREMINLIKL